jgi:tetratricopeptide (TPR) repeat protein
MTGVEAHADGTSVSRGDDGIRVCLAMIVRNEAAVLPRMVASLDGVVDQWLVVDTGSSDGTPELLTELLGALPGRVEHRPWRNFGHNRTELIQLAGQLEGVTHLLLLDADHTVATDADWRTRLAAEDADEFLIAVDSGDHQFHQSYLVRTGPAWRYEGPTHEYLTCDDPVARTTFDAIRITHHADGGARHDKFERDLTMLLEHLNDQPDDQRSTFYLAQTYRDLGRSEEALQAYERRAALGGWDEEVYYSLLQVGEMHHRLGRTAEAAWAWQRAVEVRPSRAESFHRLGRMLNEHSQWQPARVWLEHAATLPPSKDLLFVEQWVEQWGVVFELAIARWWTGDRDAADAAFAELVQRPDIPVGVREACQRNLELPAGE